MKLRKYILFAAITLIAASGSFAIGLSGLDVGRAITESRCDAGAFMYHLDGTGDTEPDGNAQVSVQATPAVQHSTRTAFDRPIVTLTYDDGWASIHDNALPLMKKYGLTSTQYIISGYVGQAKAYMTTQDVYDFRNSGHEIAGHTVDHPDIATLDPSKLNFELQRSQADLTKCYGPVVDFAAPYGSTNPGATARISTTYQTARLSGAGYNTPQNLNPYGLLVQNVDVDTTQAQLDTWLHTAQRNGSWLILVYHQIDNSGEKFSRRPADLDRDLQAVKASGMTVETVRDAYREVKPQLK